MVKEVKKNSKSGFTLIELLVVIGIIATLATTVTLVSLNPSKQINKVRDAEKKQDLSQIKTALDTYYNDLGCYPSVDYLKSKFGQEWKEGKTVYMKKIPQSSNPASPYIYLTDPSSCPQWNILFAKLQNPQIGGGVSQASLCPLVTQENCTPPGYDNSYICTLSGKVDCSYLATAGGIFPSPTPTSGPTDTPTPTPTQIPPAPITFYVSLNSGIYPNFTQGTVDPQFPRSGVTQTVSLNVVDPSTVQSVSVLIKTDTKQATIPLRLTSGTATDGTWSASWAFYNDTYNNNYCLKFTATDVAGNTSDTEPCFK